MSKKFKKYQYAFFILFLSFFFIALTILLILILANKYDKMVNIFVFDSTGEKSTNIFLFCPSLTKHRNIYEIYVLLRIRAANTKSHSMSANWLGSIVSDIALVLIDK